MRDCTSVSEKGRAPVRAPCPGRLCGLIVRLLGLSIIGAKFRNLRVRQVEDFRSQEQIALVEAFGVFPFAIRIFVATLDGNGVVGPPILFVTPDGRRDGIHRNFGGWFCSVRHGLSFRGWWAT